MFVQVTFILENKHQKDFFFIKVRAPFWQIRRPFCTSDRMRIYIRMPQTENWIGRHWPKIVII